MRSPSDSSSPSKPSLANVFSPAFLAAIREREEVLTAAEAEFSGPWRCEPVKGRPGAVAVLREWESAEGRDLPEAVMWHSETALLLATILPAMGREPLFHLSEESGAEGFAVRAVYGEQGSEVVGWLRRYEPEVVAALHLAEYLARTPAAMAAVLEASGWGAIEQVGTILARRMMG